MTFLALGSTTSSTGAASTCFPFPPALPFALALALAFALPLAVGFACGLAFGFGAASASGALPPPSLPGSPLPLALPPSLP
eukprot:11211593-Karenia_brevis.AAC.1